MRWVDHSKKIFLGLPCRKLFYLSNTMLEGKLFTLNNKIGDPMNVINHVT